MITGWRLCSYLWLTFFVLWMVAAVFTKRSAVRISWQRGLRYGIPVVLGYYLMFSLKIDIPWLQHRLFQRSESPDNPPSLSRLQECYWLRGRGSLWAATGAVLP